MASQNNVGCSGRGRDLHAPDDKPVHFPLHFLLVVSVAVIAVKITLNHWPRAEIVYPFGGSRSESRIVPENSAAQALSLEARNSLCAQNRLPTFHYNLPVLG